MASAEKPFGTFRDDARWVHDRLAVEFTVEFTLDFRDNEGSRAITCRVSREALMDGARAKLATDAAETLRLFRSFKDRIESVVDRKLKLAYFQEDGSIMVTTIDLNG